MAVFQLRILNELNLCVQECQIPLSVCPEEGEARYSQSEALIMNSSAP